MTLQLVLFIVSLGAVVFFSVRAQAKQRARPNQLYQGVFSATAIGLLFLGAGIAGWDLRHSRGWFRGAAWVDGPVWWQVGFGAALLVLAAVWVRSLLRRS